jgi:hypothetical protein
LNIPQFPSNQLNLKPIWFNSLLSLKQKNFKTKKLFLFVYQIPEFENLKPEKYKKKPSQNVAPIGQLCLMLSFSAQISLSLISDPLIARI